MRQRRHLPSWDSIKMTDKEIVSPEPIKKNVDASGYKTPEELIFRKEFEKELGMVRRHVNFSITITIGVAIAFFLGFATMVIAYFQILQTTVNEFRQSKEKYNEEYYQLLEKRVDMLENATATSSAK